MRCEYSLTVVCRCPVADCPDVYQVTVRTDRTLMVEDILRESGDLAKAPRTQEEFTETLSRRLNGVEVETAGVHTGVRVRVVCGVQAGTTDQGASGGRTASSCAASTASSHDG